MKSILAFAAGAALAVAGTFLSQPASAQGFPQKPITLVVPVAAGGAADSLARSWAEYMTRALGQAVVVDNKPGANGSLAAAYVAKRPADGYTLLFGSTSNMSLNPFSYDNLAYDPVRDFDPVTMIATTSQVLITSAGTGIKSLADLVREARAKPDKLDFGSAGKGNSTQLYVEFVLQHFGIKATHVPYKGAAPAMIGLLGGETQFGSDAISSVVPQVKAGKVVPLLVFGSQRSPALPGVPTVYEEGMKNFPAAGWYGLMAPHGTPRAVIDLLGAQTRKFWADPQMLARMNELYMDPPSAIGPEAVAEAMRSEARTWGPIIKQLGIRND
jgi:tripartite-type tricarboxylate transporter receptor subunit TctC